jgi:hypothetical protein
MFNKRKIDMRYFVITLATLASIATAQADDGTWNAGASRNLPNGTGGNDGRSNAGMSNNLPNGTGGSATAPGRGR